MAHACQSSRQDEAPQPRSPPAGHSSGCRAAAATRQSATRTDRHMKLPRAQARSPLLAALRDLGLCNHELRVPSCVARRTSLIAKNATIGGLDLVVAPKLPDESDHHSSSLNVDEPEALCRTPEPSDGRLADAVQARDPVLSPMMPPNAGDCHLAVRPGRPSPCTGLPGCPDDMYRCCCRYGRAAREALPTWGGFPGSGRG